MDRKPTLFYVENDYGCGIRAGRTLAQARKTAIREEGTNNFRSIRHATKSDIDWVSGMGGWVPDGVIKKAVESNEDR